MAPVKPPWLTRPGAPALLAVEERAPDRRRLELEVAADSPWVEGHFPDRAVLPGVVQLRWAIEAAGWSWPELTTVRAISNLKFQHPVLPPARLTLELELERREGAHGLKFAYAQDGQACSRGGVAFA